MQRDLVNIVGMDSRHCQLCLLSTVVAIFLKLHGCYWLPRQSHTTEAVVKVELFRVSHVVIRQRQLISCALFLSKKAACQIRARSLKTSLQVLSLDICVGEQTS